MVWFLSQLCYSFLLARKAVTNDDVAVDLFTDLSHLARTSLKTVADQSFFKNNSQILFKNISSNDANRLQHTASTNFSFG